MAFTPTTWPNAALALALATLLWYTLSALTTRHRLRHFPGPPLASFSYLWGVRAMSSGRMHRVLRATQRAYGPLVRIGPNELLAYDPETLWHVNGVRAAYARGGWYESIRFDPAGHSVLSEPDTGRHDARKAALAGAYAGRGKGGEAGVDLEGVVDEQVAVLVGLLERRYLGGRALDFARVARYFTVDVTTLAGMGEAWGDLAAETDMYHFLGDSDAFVPFMHCISMAPALRAFFTSPFFLAVAGPKTTDKSGMGQFLGVAKKEAEKRFGAGTAAVRDRRDMLDEWIKNGLTPAECQREVALVVPAGSETTTTAIRGTMLHVLTSPLVYQKLKSEIAEGIKQGRISSPITSEEAKQLPYLQAVLNEGIRMVPPAITGFSKRVPPGGDTLCGKFVPGGTDIMVNVCEMLRNRDVFGDDADSFRPERFLEGDNENKAQLLRVMDLAFGHGRWMCPGKALAWMELNKVFVELLRRFDFQILNPENPWRCKGYSSFLIDEFWISVLDGRIDKAAE